MVRREAASATVETNSTAWAIPAINTPIPDRLPLRGVVVGRKNHYGSKSRRGTEVAAIFYSLVESAKLAGVEPRAYLHAAAVAALRSERIPLPHETAAPA